MASVSGSIIGITIAGRNFSVAASANAELHLGGWVNRTEINGNKTARIVQSWSGWSLTGIEISIDHERADLEYLTAATADAGGAGLELRSPTENKWLTGGEDLSGMRKFYPVELELVGGAVYTGKGIPVGKIVYSTMTGTAALDLEGDGALSQ